MNSTLLVFATNCSLQLHWTIPRQQVSPGEQMSLHCTLCRSHACTCILLHMNMLAQFTRTCTACTLPLQQPKNMFALDRFAAGDHISSSSHICQPLLMAINNGVSLFVMMSYGVSLCKMRCRWHWCICWRRYRALCYGTIRVMQFYDPSLTSSLLSSLLWAIYSFDRHHCHGCSKFKITKVCFTAELFQLSSARSAFVPLFPQVISIFSVYNRIPMIYSTA